MADDYGPAGSAADSGVHPEELADGETVALITLTTPGKIRTAASGPRVEMVATSGNDMLLFWSGSGQAGDAPGFQYAYYADGIPVLALYPPHTDARPVPCVLLLGSGATAADAAATFTGHVWPNADGTKDLGAVGSSWRSSVVYGLCDEAGAAWADLSAQTEAAWTQTWKAVTTDPDHFTLTAGFQARTGRRVTAHAIITCDGDFTAGSGIYIFGCPVAPSASYTASGSTGNADTLGTIRLKSAATGINYEGHLTLRSLTGAGTCHAVFHEQTARWGHTGAPAAPAATDVLVIAWDYLAAAA
jgi:hypothetical protein